MATERCLICGKFYREPGPEPRACPGHVYDWMAMSERERAELAQRAIYRPVAARADR